MDDLILDLKHFYTELKSQTRETGRASRFHCMDAKYEKDFEAAAELCQRFEIVPEEFIAVIFASLEPGQMFPKAMHGKLAEEKLVRFNKSQTRISFDDYFKLNKAWFDAQRDKGYSEESILLTDWIQFEPWFRICYPKNLTDKLHKRWGKEARAQYRNSLREFLIGKNLDYTRLLK